MEKKTIGGFIAALRKANGMTQKDLADRLNVSDKTISRWERNDGDPDLSVIPVIAEIFGVTCDELLRGERKSPEERAEPLDCADTTPKGEKQRQRLLKATLSQYKSQTYIAMGVSVAGFIVALICNLAFLKAVLGFLCGAIFFAASIVCQAIFLNRSFLSVEDAGLDETDLSVFRKSVIMLAEKSIGVTVAFTGFTFPLILVDAYMGLGVDSLLLFGVVGAALFLLIYAVVCYFINASFIKRGTYTLDAKEAVVYRHNHKLKKICAVILVSILLATFIGHQFATSIWGPYSIMDGTTFTDYESFIAYMEQDIPYESHEYSDYMTAPIPHEQIGETTYYDEFGNEISEDEANRRTLEDKNGDVVCEYTDRNKSVVSMNYTPRDGTILPITVHTQDDLDDARQKASIRHVIFGVAYCIECLAIVMIYFKKRAK